MEDLLRSMSETSADDEPIYILTMTDYDPAGYFIANTFFNQVRDLRESLDIKRNVYIKRIGIFPSQLTDDEIRQNWYTPKPVNMKKWMQETGGINGKEKGLELDALEPARIRHIFLESLREYIDQSLYTDFIKRAYLQQMILSSMQDKIAGIVDNITGEALKHITIADADLFEIAAGGSRYIPIKDLCWTNKAQAIREKVLAQFA
ncbi:MAG: hypothetical protein EOM66_11420 [Clostridia bacterium]|nr:hypothetical protein [Clostridia bacterium]